MADSWSAEERRRRPRAARATPGPSGAAATQPAAAMIALSLVVIALVLFGGWPGFGVGLAVLVAGLAIMTRYLKRLALGGSRAERGREPAPAESLSPHDVPRSSPLHREVERQLRERGRQRRQRSRRGERSRRR